MEICPPLPTKCAFRSTTPIQLLSLPNSYASSGKMIGLPEDAYEFGNDKSWMGVVDLNAHFVGKGGHISMHAQMAADNVLERGGDEKKLLFQADSYASSGRPIIFPGNPPGKLARLFAAIPTTPFFEKASKS